MVDNVSFVVGSVYIRFMDNSPTNQLADSSTCRHSNSPTNHLAKIDI